jgi:hypothetical protein
MFSTLPAGSSPQEMFISPLESVTPLEMQNAVPPSAHTNAYAHISGATASVPPSTYSASPAPSDFSLSLHALQPHRMFEAPTKGPMVNLDVDMAAYTQGLANFNIPMDMGLSYVVPEMPPLSFDISEQMFADALQEPQQRGHVPIAAPIAIPVDAGFAFNDVINEF